MAIGGAIRPRTCTHTTTGVCRSPGQPQANADQLPATVNPSVLVAHLLE